MKAQNAIQKILEKHGWIGRTAISATAHNTEMEALARELSWAIIKQFEDWGYANMDELESIKKDFTLPKAEGKG